MRLHDRLVVETTADRDRFLAIPLVRVAITRGVDRSLYRRFLEQAYYHVRHTCPLFERSIAACGSDDSILAAAFRHYIEEERGHDDWILDDIADLGGDVGAIRSGQPGKACAAMCQHAYRLIEEDGPYAILGMVHVLEGLSVLLAQRVADKIMSSIGSDENRGFRYLTSHGSLDASHVAFFAYLLDAIGEERTRQNIINAARQFYRLYGEIFYELGRDENSCAT